MTSTPGIVPTNKFNPIVFGSNTSFDQSFADNRYVRVGAFAYLSGASVSGALSCTSLTVNGVSIVGNGITQTFADARYEQIGTGFTQSAADSRYVQLSGGDLTGPLTITKLASQNMFTINNSGSGFNIFSYSNGSTRLNASGGALVFQVNDVPIVACQTSGNVGVKTLSPTYPLDVVGDVNCAGVYRIYGNTVLSLSGGIVTTNALASTSLSTGAVTAKSLLVEDPSHTNGTQTYLQLGNTFGSTWVWKLYRDSLAPGSNFWQLTYSGSTNYQGIAMNSSGFMSLNTTGGSGSVLVPYSTSQYGALHINGSKSANVPSGWGYAYNGASSVGGGTVPVSIYTSNHIWCGGNVYSTSDRRRKCNIEDCNLEHAKKLLDAKVVNFNWKSNPDNEKKQLGLIAQDLLELGLEDMVGVVGDADVEDGFSYVVSYERVSLYLLEIVKDLVNQMTLIDQRRPQRKR